MRYASLSQELGGGDWGLHGFTLTQGGMKQWPVGSSSAELSNVTGWKFAAVIDYDYYGGGPDIRFELVDRCPAGGGEVIVRAASRAPLKARIRMTAGYMPIFFHGRCLWVRVRAEHLPGSSVKIWASDYYYTNARSEHDM